MLAVSAVRIGAVPEANGGPDRRSGSPVGGEGRSRGKPDFLPFREGQKNRPKNKKIEGFKY